MVEVQWVPPSPKSNALFIYTSQQISARQRFGPQECANVLWSLAATRRVWIGRTVKRVLIDVHRKV